MRFLSWLASRSCILLPGMPQLSSLLSHPPGVVARKGGLCSSRCPALPSPSELTIVYSEILFYWQPANVTSGSVFIN